MKQLSIWESEQTQFDLSGVEHSFSVWVADVHGFNVQTGKRVREVHAMPVTIVTKDKPAMRGKNVYGTRVQRGDLNPSVAKDDEETFVCGTCANMIGGVEIKGECGATLVVCPAPILRQWQDEISRSFSSPFQYLLPDSSLVIVVVLDLDVFVQ